MCRIYDNLVGQSQRISVPNIAMTIRTESSNTCHSQSCYSSPAWPLLCLRPQPMKAGREERIGDGRAGIYDVAVQESRQKKKRLPEQRKRPRDLRLPENPQPHRRLAGPAGYVAILQRSVFRRRGRRWLRCCLWSFLHLPPAVNLEARVALFKPKATGTKSSTSRLSLPLSGTTTFSSPMLSSTQLSPAKYGCRTASRVRTRRA